jgi:catechol 2,3-dioxygenase-like lactoylglutathione lyase family enzyme
MNPIKPKRIDHVVLRVADLAASMRFYRDILGFPLAHSNEEAGLHQFRAGASMIDLVALDGRIGRAGGETVTQENRNMDHFAVTLAEYDEPAIIAHLEGFGVKPYGSARRFGAEGRGTSILVTDPDGNTVELKGPADEI